MNRRDDVYNPPGEPEGGPEPTFRCARCKAPLTCIMGHVEQHECPVKKKTAYIPPKYERAGGRDWMT
jgi:hypothetical protein